ncbi:MAG TPA: serine hydrolase [Pirellula sp.]|nr:serine hydrolase [Pirellula sp.]
MFKSVLLILCVATIFHSAIRAEDSVPAFDRIHAAISKALPTLEAGSVGSADKRQCFTCHSQALPVFAFVEAKRQGFTVNEDNLKRQLKHTYDHLKRGLANYRQGKGQGGDVLTAGYALWTLDEGDWPADEVTHAVSHYLLKTQSDIKHWRHRGSRPPTSGSDFTATYVALRALTHFGTEEQQEPIAERRKLVADWMAFAQPLETEDFVFRLSSLQYLNCELGTLDEAVSALLKLQREDGGWGQKADMTSDAYATGSALTSLIRDGHIPSTNESIRQGIDYLLSTQLDDGTWQVTTRAKPVQEYFESNFPHGKDQFISVSATAWSTLALLHSVQPADDRKAALNSLPATEESPDEAVSSLADLDRVIQEFMTKHEVPGASIAVTEDSKIVYSKGFGFADSETQLPVQPTSLFRIASLSKPITAVAILQLVEQGKLKLDDRAFAILDFDNEIGAIGADFDVRLHDVTIEHLLQHRGGWDRDTSFDPMFQSVRFAKQQGVPAPARQREIILSMLSQKLDFDPGERYAYSNYGYCLLGRIIEKIVGVSYEKYVQAKVLQPLGIRSMQIGSTRLNGRVPGEVHYYASGNTKSVFQSDLGEGVPPPYGAWNLEAMDSHGGWIATAEDLLKFAASFDDLDHCPILSRESIERMHARPMGFAGYDKSNEPKESFYSLGWLNRVTADGSLNHWHTGSLPGTSAILIRRRDGHNMVALLNTRDSKHSEPLGKAIDKLLHKAANAVEQLQSSTE